MSIKAKCPNPACGKVLTIKEEYAGKTGKCPACGLSIKIPAAPAPGAKPPTSAPSPSPKASAKTASTPPRPKVEPEEDYEVVEEEPPAPKPARTSSTAPPPRKPPPAPPKRKPPPVEEDIEEPELIEEVEVIEDEEEEKPSRKKERPSPMAGRRKSREEEEEEEPRRKPPRRAKEVLEIGDEEEGEEEVEEDSLKERLKRKRKSKLAGRVDQQTIILYGVALLALVLLCISPFLPWISRSGSTKVTVNGNTQTHSGSASFEGWDSSDGKIIFGVSLGIVVVAGLALVLSLSSGVDRQLSDNLLSGGTTAGVAWGALASLWQIGVVIKTLVAWSKASDTIDRLTKQYGVEAKVDITLRILPGLGLILGLIAALAAVALFFRLCASRDRMLWGLIGGGAGAFIGLLILLIRIQPWGVNGGWGPR